MRHPRPTFYTPPTPTHTAWPRPREPQPPSPDPVEVRGPVEPHKDEDRPSDEPGYGHGV
ncbi:MAG: hypothetical protein LAO77_18715 [Acidobacteriia bacterium]|nr:hypothetical protein [Terriglobia bacterium]